MRFWLIPAIALLAVALALGANLVLLGYAQPRNDPVGQLTPARLLEIQRTLPKAATTSPALSPEPRLHQRVPGRGEDD
ncbi:MAG: hypothetical protein ABSB96_11100 [Gaiellaceae bacterium]